MPGVRIGLDEALDLTRTGDVWVFRGHTAADRAIQLTTNSPVNHVGMSVVLEDLPALMWHAELGRSLPARRPPNWYDAGRFWSGDDLRLSAGARLGGEIAVQIPEAQLSAARSTS